MRFIENHDVERCNTCAVSELLYHQMHGNI